MGWAWDWEDSAQDPANRLPCTDLSWRLDTEDGLEIGTGCSVSVSGLDVGMRQIWLVATDSDGQEGKTYVEFTIQ